MKKETKKLHNTIERGEDGEFIDVEMYFVWEGPEIFDGYGTRPGYWLLRGIRSTKPLTSAEEDELREWADEELRNC